MKVAISAGAMQDLAEAMQWYEGRRLGLGDDFLDEYERVESLLARQPRLFAREEHAPTDQEVRQSQLQRFPYRVIYWLKAETIIVLAVAHSKRRPEYWVDRLSEE